MSDETGKPKASSERRATTIDLDKTAVKDITDKDNSEKAAPHADGVQEAAEKSAKAAEAVLPPTEPAADVPKGPDSAAAAEAAQPVLPPPESPPVAPMVVPARRGSSAGAITGGAIAGALFGMLGAYGLPLLKPPAADPRLSQLETSLAALEKRATDASQIEQRLKAEIARAEAKATAAEGKAAAAEQRATTAESKAGAFDSRATAVEQRAEAANQKSAAVEQMAAGLEQKAALLLAPLEDRLKSAESRLSDARDQAVALGKRVDLLAQIEPPKVDLRPIITKIDELDRSVASTTARLSLSSDASSSVDGRIKTIEGVVKTVETGLKAVETGLSQLQATTTELGAQSRGLEAGIAEIKTRKGPDIAAILGISGLARRALDDGQPLGTYIAALKAAGAADAATAALAPFAQTAAPRTAALADLYAGLAARLPAAKPAQPAPQDGSIVGKVTSSLWSQVEVKSVGAPDTTGIGSAIRQRLAAGDLAGTLDLLKPLTPEQQAALKPFSDAIAARIGAAQALKAIETDALAAAARKG